MEPDDNELLRAFREEGSQEAFATLARRHAGLLYHAALRQTGHPGLAEEAAQNALAILARKAPSLRPGPSLAPWLHRTVCFEAAKLRRRERRHDDRMKHLHDPSLIPVPPLSPGQWESLEPHLDQVLNELSEPDRQVVLLKYFDGWTFEEMASRLGGQSSAWRQRGSRALERLRRRLARRGVVVPLTVLAAGLQATLSQTAPAAVAATLTSAPLVSAAALSGKTLALHTLYTMNAKQVSITAALALALLVPLGFQAAAISRSRMRVAALENSATSVRPTAGLAKSGPVVSSRSGSVEAGSPSSSDAGASAAAIDLNELAQLLEEGRDADLVRVVKLRTALENMDATALAKLLTAAENLDFPRDQRGRLYGKLLTMLAEKDPVLAMTTGMRLVASLSGSEAIDLWMNPLPNCLREWAEKDPAAARVWYDQQKKADTFANKSLRGADLDGWMAAGLFTGMMWGGDRDAGQALFETLNDGAKAMSLRRFGTSNTKPEDHAQILKLAVGIADPGARTEALLGASTTLGRSNLDQAGTFIAQAGLPSSETRKLLVAAAVAELKDTPDIDVAGRVTWLRAQTPADQQEKALGYFLGEATFVDHAGIKQKVDAELDAGASNTFLGAFIRNAAHRTSTMDIAVSYLAQLTDPVERSRTLREIQQGHRDVSRNAAMQAGVSAAELDTAAQSD